MKNFPNEFSIDFVELGQTYSVQFYKIPKHKHPVSSADIYVLDDDTKNPIKYEPNDDLFEVCLNRGIIKAMLLNL